MISRKRSYPGMTVAINTREGERVEGTLLAWGPSVIRINEAGKWREFSNIGITVEALAR